MLAGLPHDTEITMTEMEEINLQEQYRSMLRRMDRTVEMLAKADEIRAADACDRVAVKADAASQIAGLPSRGLQRDMELRRLAKVTVEHVYNRLEMELNCLLLCSLAEWQMHPDPEGDRASREADRMRVEGPRDAQ